jgi:uncharacterized Tic20 family protein
VKDVDGYDYDRHPLPHHCGCGIIISLSNILSLVPLWADILVFVLWRMQKEEDDSIRHSVRAREDFDVAPIIISSVW